MGHIITIDGPSGSGKSTIAKLLSKKIDAIYLDTGKMYRAITFFLLKEEVCNLYHLPQSLLEKAKLSLTNKGEILLDREDITRNLIGDDISLKVPIVAQNENVRKFLVKMQRSFAKNHNLIADGRDMGTVVFKNAILKIYLDANIDIRAKRRYEQLKSKGDNVNLDEVRENMKKRDKIDREREISPLKKAEDAIVINSTDLSEDEVVNNIIYLFNERVKYCG